MEMKNYDVVIVGAGVAGLNVALWLPQDKKILILCKGKPEESDSYLAQGGICMMRGEEDFEGYYEDTMRAGHYENNPQTVACMIKNSPELIADLVDLGVAFARDSEGNFRFTREGGHRRPRILFHEDCTGLEITTKLFERVMALPNVTLQDNTTVVDVIEEDGQTVGVIAVQNQSRDIEAIFADYVVLATGGVGGLFTYSTNYKDLTGDALAICLNHNVKCENLDYIQIHPTTLYSQKKGRKFLISESVRGEGALLLNGKGERFTDELKPRDIVTQAIYDEMAREGSQHVWLDMRPIGKKLLLEHFPTIVKRCQEEGYDVFTTPIPVIPSHHYFMGGITSSLQGETTMPRLYAVGETCCNGVHGKNRLASNSLLESLLFAKRCAFHIKDNYEKVDECVWTEVKKKVDFARYTHLEEILENYKKQILTQMEISKNEHGN